MKRETIKQYTVLYQYLLLLKEPTYIFLIQIFQHLSPSNWWEEYIEPVLRYENKENFKYLDMSDLLNVIKMNWKKIFKYLNKNHFKIEYDDGYKLVNEVHRIRTIIAHANENEMSPFVFIESLSSLSNYSKLIQADKILIQKLELDWRKYRKELPANHLKKSDEEQLKSDILSVIETKVLLKAVKKDSLPSDIKLSVDRTTLRLHSMRTVEEIIGFFNNAMLSERGMAVHAALNKEGLLSFEDIKEEINRIYNERIPGHN